MEGLGSSLKSPLKPRDPESLGGPNGSEKGRRRADGKTCKMLAIGGSCLVLILVLAVALPVILTKPCDDGKETKEQVLLPCEDGWILYMGICYFFSETDGSWANSHNFCASHKASLAVIATQKEMDFVMRFKGVDDHWIGLSREPKGEWKWPNGTPFNNWFNITGDSNCAYLNHDGAKNARCYAERKWICTIGDVIGQRQTSLFPGGTNLDPKKDK